MDYFSKEAKALNAEIDGGNIPLRRLRLFLREVAEPSVAIPMIQVEDEEEEEAAAAAAAAAAPLRARAWGHRDDCECCDYRRTCRDCGRTPHFDTSIKCEVCERVLDCCHASKEQPDRFCFSCHDYVRSVPIDYPEDSLSVATWDRDVFYALVLRIAANDNREAEHDTDNDAEKVNCRAESYRLDKIATRLLMNHPSFKPWWIERWDYWRQPGSMHAVPAWAPKKEATLVQPPHSPLKPPAPVTKRPNYTHSEWPSPRAKLFANELSVETKFRKHEDALQFLATRASMTVDQLLKMSLQDYVKKHNGGKLPTHLRTNLWRGW